MINHSISIKEGKLYGRQNNNIMKRIFINWNILWIGLCVMGLLTPYSMQAQSAIGQLESMTGQSINSYSGYTPSYVSSYDSEAAAEARAAAAEARAEAAAARQAAAAIRRAKAAEERKKKQFAKDMKELYEMTARNKEKAAAEEAKRQAAFAKSMQPARSLIQSVAVVGSVASGSSLGNTNQSNVSQSGRGQMIGGLTETEWQEARNCQQEIARITSVWPVPGKDLPLLERLELTRNTLWKKAVSVSGLTPSERERLRIKLYTRDVYASDVRSVSLSRDDIDALRQEAPQRSADTPLPPGETNTENQPVSSVISSLLSDMATDKAEETVEGMGEDLIKWRLNAVDDVAKAKLKDGEVLTDSKLETYAPLFEPIITIAKVAVATKRSVASGITEGLNYAVSKITMPRAKEAIEGGQQYASASDKSFTAFIRATNNFYSKMGMKGFVDPDEFRKNMANDGNLAQKVGMRFLQKTDE